MFPAKKCKELPGSIGPLFTHLSWYILCPKSEVPVPLVPMTVILVVHFPEVILDALHKTVPKVASGPFGSSSAVDFVISLPATISPTNSALSLSALLSLGFSCQLLLPPSPLKLLYLHIPSVSCYHLLVPSLVCCYPLSAVVASLYPLSPPVSFLQQHLLGPHQGIDFPCGPHRVLHYSLVPLRILLPHRW